VKKILQKGNQKNSDEKPLGSGSIGYGVPTPVGASFDKPPSISLSFPLWSRAACRLRSKESFHNSWRGLPEGWRFERLYKDGHSPLEALETWRDWEPFEDA
jgi:hypothetical protein